MKKYLLAALLLTTVLFLGCHKSTLAPGGAYDPITVSNGVTNSAPDMPLFLADSAYQVAYGAIDAVFTIERNNRTFLWSLSPKIKQTLDGIRPQAVEANVDYLRARSAYIANPVQANLTGLQSVLAKIQQLAIAAQAALPKGQ